jgi:hypothetical protein
MKKMLGEYIGNLQNPLGTHWELEGNLVTTHWEPGKNEKKNLSPHPFPKNWKKKKCKAP